MSADCGSCDTARRRSPPRRVDGRAGSRAGRADLGRRASRPGTRTRCSASSAATLVAVLRRPPRTPLSPTAHDMAREFRVLQRVARSRRVGTTHAPVPVPEPIACCTDVDVIGVPFYLMHVVDGVVVRESLPPSLARRRRTRARACAFALVDALAGIHASTGRRAASTASAGPTATSNARCRAGSVSSSATRRVRCPTSTRRGEWLAGAHAAGAAAGRDPRRLQARQRDVRAAPPGRARRGRRLGAVDGRRSARRPRLGARAVGRAGRRGVARGRRRRSRAAPTCRRAASCSTRYAERHRPRPDATSTTTACSACSSSRA